ncbi:MAG: helix-turn-helix transcriptional regulator [Bacillota bacterium]|nr:helix-turn-helix transcriptional regulator [Bacillota bacterium]
MNTIDKEKFGQFIATKRKDLSLTQKDLAEKLFISPQAISKWERGQSYPDISLLIPLADILQVKLVDLLQGQEDFEERQPADVEGLIKNVVAMTATNPEGERKKKKKNLLIFALVSLMGVLEYFVFYKYINLSLNLLLTPFILGLLFASQTWLFLKEKLPAYYDENKISFVSNGVFRINLVGLSFNNSNWKPVLNYLRFWTISVFLLSPFIFLALERSQSNLGSWLYLFLILGSAFGPVYFLGKKYQ